MDAEAELAKEEIEHTATMQRIAQQVIFTQRVKTCHGNFSLAIRRLVPTSHIVDLTCATFSRVLT